MCRTGESVACALELHCRRKRSAIGVGLTEIMVFRSEMCMEQENELIDWRDQGIVPDNSFLRRIPDIMQPEQKMRIDYLVYCCDVIYHSYHSIVNLALLVHDDLSLISREMQTNFFVPAWSIVDNIHAARQIIRSLAPPEGVGPGVTREFLEDSDIARKMRNEMDHLSGNIPKIYNKKGNKSPLFGAVCYVISSDPVSQGATVVIVKSGQMHGKESWIIPKMGDRPFHIPVDFITLNSFGLECDFAPLIDKLAISMQLNANRWEQNILDHVERLAQGSGTCKEALLRHTGGGYAVALEVSFSYDPLEDGS